jgi:peptidoglycan/LPS O-acetylase OafA/YrhL
MSQPPAPHSGLGSKKPPLQHRPTLVRPEIQALRAFAVLAVVLNHLWPERITGGFLGVDMFFAISGFLITGHLVRDVGATGTLRIGRFWLRRVRRLLPASLLVLFAVALATFVLLPHALWSNVLSQVIASAAYFENWLLGANAVDYFASRSAPSPVMHYWSLSVEEQFYLVWPLLILVAVAFGAAINRKRARTSIPATSSIPAPSSIPATSWILGVIAIVTAISLAFSIWISVAAPDAAYFNTAARAWQFGLGGLVALLGARLGAHAGPRFRACVAAAGWATIVASMALITGDFALPGIVSAFPVIGTLMVIWAGSPRSRLFVFGALRIRPVQMIGDISYSLYLWHWPLIIFWPYLFAAPLGTVGKISVFAAAILLAYLTKRFVEDPIRTAPYLALGPARRHLWIAGATAIVIGLSASGIAVVAGSAAAAVADAQQRASAGCFAAAAMAPDASCEAIHQLLSTDLAVAASGDMDAKADHGAVCLTKREVSKVTACVFGASKETAKLTVALVGDSHAYHWVGALNAIAEKESWRIVEYVKSSCPGILSPSIEASWYPEGASACHTWTSAVVAEIAARDDIDVVLTASMTRDYVEAPPRGGAKGVVSAASLQRTWDAWVASGKQVVVLADTPNWQLGDVPTCVSASGTDDPCAFPASARDGDPKVDAVLSRPTPGIHLIDLNDYLCDATLCHVAIGGVVAIGDGNHLTQTFSVSLSPYLGPMLVAAFGQ